MTPRALRVDDLPPPPPGRVGWPWTEGCPPLPPVTPGGNPWPKISIVTPSYQQGRYLEETIRSVLLQGYPRVEYHVMDGGSRDETVGILRTYEPWLTSWVSEKDKGQSDAINRGLAKVTGEVWAYMNSDDYYLPGCFAAVGAAFADDATLMMLSGPADYVDEQGGFVRRMEPTPFESLGKALIRWEGPRHPIAIQVSNFHRRSVLERFGAYDESLHYCMDFDFGLRLMVAGVVPRLLAPVLAHARLHGESKTVNQHAGDHFRREDLRIVARYLDRLPPADRAYALPRYRAAVRRMELDMLRGGLPRVSPRRAMGFLLTHPWAWTHRPFWGIVRKSLF